MKEINIHSGYITLGQFLKFTGIISNGGESRSFLETNDVKVCGVAEKRRGKKLFNENVVEINGVLYIVRGIR